MFHFWLNTFFVNHDCLVDDWDMPGGASGQDDSTSTSSGSGVQSSESKSSVGGGISPTDSKQSVSSSNTASSAGEPAAAAAAAMRPLVAPAPRYVTRIFSVCLLLVYQQVLGPGSIVLQYCRSPKNWGVSLLA